MIEIEGPTENQWKTPALFVHRGKKKISITRVEWRRDKKNKRKKKRKIFGRWTHTRALSFPHATLKGYYRHDDFNNIKKSYNQSLKEVAHSSQIKLFSDMLARELHMLNKNNNLVLDSLSNLQFNLKFHSTQFQ